MLFTIVIITCNFTDTTDLNETTCEEKEIELETDIVEAKSNEDINNISEEQIQTKEEETPIIEEVIPNKESGIPNTEKETPDKEEVISNKEEHKEVNIENAEEQGMSLDDWTGLDSNEIVMDEANMDDWIADGEDWN